MSESHKITTLAEALRFRAKWLRNRSSSALEFPWGDTSSVIASLLETADVIDSWSGEYLSKEETYKINEYRKYSFGNPSDPMTMEERKQAVSRTEHNDLLKDQND